MKYIEKIGSVRILLSIICTLSVNIKMNLHSL